MIEINEAFSVIVKNFGTFCDANNFAFRYNKDTMASKELPLEITDTKTTLYLEGATGTAIITYDSSSNQIKLLGSADKGAKAEDCKELSAWLLEPSVADVGDVKSISNDFREVVEDNFATRKDTDLSKVKLPQAISKSKAKSGAVSYDPQTLAKRFVMIFPEYGDALKQNIVDYGELLPLDFCDKYITPKFQESLEGKLDDKTCKKFYKMLAEIYEDGTNETQDIIAVNILSYINNSEENFAKVEPFMSDYMKPTIRTINKMMAGGKGKSYRKKMANPPAYKPKKQKQGLMQKLAGGQTSNSLSK